MVNPEIAAVTRVQNLSGTLDKISEPVQIWTKLKEESAALTRKLQKMRAKQKDQVLSTNQKDVKVWVKKNQETEPSQNTQVDGKETSEQETGDAEEEKKGHWKELSDRVANISVQIAELAQAFPAVEKILEQQGLKEAYEVNRTGIRDDQAPVVSLECKIRKHWKPLDKVTLDGGAGVNVMSARVCKLLGLTCKAAPFQLRMANQTVAEPQGLVEDVPIRVGGVRFNTSFLVLDVGEAYDMLLGRPWLRAAGAVHDWKTDKLKMQDSKRTVVISTALAEIPKSRRPGDIYIAEASDIWKKLEANLIIPMTVVDLNR